MNKENKSQEWIFFAA